MSGFDFRVLSGFRSRLAGGAGGNGGRWSCCWPGSKGRAGGAPGGPQRTDSTHVLGRIRDLNRLELAGEAVRAALEAPAAAAPGWLAAVIDAVVAGGLRAAGRRDAAARERDRRPDARGAVRPRTAQLLEAGPGHRERRGGCGTCPPCGRCGWSWSSSTTADGRAGREVIGRNAGRARPSAGRDRIVFPYDTGARFSREARPGLARLQGPLDRDLPETGRGPVPAARPEPGHLRDDHPAAEPDVAMTTPVHDGLDGRRADPRRARRRRRVCPAPTTSSPPTPRESPCSARCSPTATLAGP